MAVTDSPQRQVGTTDPFWVVHPSPPRHVVAHAELRYVSRHAYWYVEHGFSSTPDTLRASAEVFDARTYPTVRRLIGGEAFPGIDNDPRVTIFSGDVPGVAGYVSSLDASPAGVQPFSNEREMVYVNLRAVQLGSSAFDQVLAHELVHLVHQNLVPADDTWIKEGLADLVAAAVFPEPGLSSAAWLANPDVQLTSWTDGPGGSVPATLHYQAAARFLDYFTNRFGVRLLGERLRHPPGGLAAFDAVLPRLAAELTFASVFRDWTVANLGAARAGSTVAPYATPIGGTPTVRTLSIGSPIRDTVAQFGVDYFEVAPHGRVVVEFEGDAQVPLVATAAPEGSVFWYGGRADMSVASLTRPFDLRAVLAASLAYRVWFDLEADYDYGYLSASVDGGVTWRLLRSLQMRDGANTGNSLGFGYTGKSGAGQGPIWIDDEVDLTELVGQVVDIRFSYITDDAIVQDGIAVDDLRIDAIGFRDGVEAHENGWQAVGWSRVGSSLPQRWGVRALARRGAAVELIDLLVDAAGRVVWESVDPVDQLTLIVSGLTPVTTHRASYQLRVREATSREQHGS